MAVTVTSVHSVLARLDAALQLARDLGLTRLATHGRFAQYRQRLLQLAELEALGRPLSGDDLDTQGAMVEALEFGQVIGLVSHVSAVVLRDKLRVVMQGPYAAADEAQNSNRARNTLFALSLASMLQRAGMVWTLGDSPDLRCIIAGHDVAIECKRPLSASGIESALRSARSQLERYDEAFGVAAISLSKAVNPGHMPLNYEDPSTASDEWEQELRRHVSAYIGEWHRNFPPSVIGVVLHLITPALQRTVRRLDCAEQLLILGLPGRGPRQSAVLHTLGTRLASLSQV